MVSLETGTGSIVTLRYLPPYQATDERAYLDALAEIGRREAPFLLLTIFGGGGKLSREGEREQALWFKATRARFGRLCGACAIVRPGANERMAETFRKLWPFPISLEPNEAAGRAFLLRHKVQAA
jgi:cytosine/adenosine deaminase-related metal-dependent hydrolase